MAHQIPTLTEAIAMCGKNPEAMAQIRTECYQRIEKFNSRFNVFLRILPPPSPNQIFSEKLFGTPIAIKDLYHLRGTPTTAGSRIFSDHIADENAVVVDKLIEYGAHIIGKANTHEIALGVTGTNPHYGDVPNPWDPERIIGGSSSGSAAAVTLGMCLVALGTDTGGSVRIPASLAGIVGFKPTFGRVSTKGIVPLSWNLDHSGTLTRCVEDAALILEIISGYELTDPYSVNMPTDHYSADLNMGVKNFKLGILSGDMINFAEPEIRAAIKAAAQVFRGLGAEVEEVKLDFLKQAALANTNMLKTDAAAFHSKSIQEQPELFGEDIRVRLLEGRDFPAAEYALARRIQTETIHRMHIFFAEFDALILPATPFIAPKFNETNPLKQAGLLNRFTAPFNLCGAPAISLPGGFSSEGLPIGLQIVAAHWNEKKLLRIAHAYEISARWEMYQPQ